MDCNENVDVIYLDFRKAFDTVPHARLINKLYAYGIRGNLLQWIQNVLTDKKQKVIVQGEESQWADVASGIPQGSVLGPVLFLIYINDLPDVVKKFVTIIADDTKEHAVIKSDVDTTEVQEDLYKMSDWSEIWEIKFNAKKCKSKLIMIENYEFQNFAENNYHPSLILFLYRKSVFSKPIPVPTAF